MAAFDSGPKHMGSHKVDPKRSRGWGFPLEQVQQYQSGMSIDMLCYGPQGTPGILHMFSYLSSSPTTVTQSAVRRRSGQQRACPEEGWQPKF